MQIYPPGTMIGQYEIVSRPQMGGMGVVYFCIDHKNDGRPVALKTFKPEYLPDRTARDRFLRECTAWVELGRHQHIVYCYKVKYIDPIVFLVLELIAKEQSRDNASLRAWMGRPMPVEQALLFSLQIARGMSHATEKIPGFVHRDLKPENVLVGADKLPGTDINRLRITDFGLVAILQGESGRICTEIGPDAVGNTQITHGIAGTPLYMAPEQWKGEPLGIYTDIYAFGCILYEMITGRHAVNGNNLSELQTAHCAEKIYPLPADLPKEVHELLINSLALRPEDRYQEWKTVKGTLEQAYIRQSNGRAPAEGNKKTQSVNERKQMSWSLNVIGVSYLRMGKTQVGLEYFKKALAITTETGDKFGEASTLCNLGNAYLTLGDIKSAIDYYKQDLAIALEIGDRRGEAETLSNLGSAYTAMGDARRAISYHEQSLAIAREIGDKHSESLALGCLGIAYKNLGDVKSAINYYKQDLAIAREFRDSREEAATLGNLGVAYALLGDIHPAIGFFEQQLAITHQIGDRLGEGSALGNLGLAYENLGDAERAIDYFEQDLAIARETGNLNGIASVSLNTAFLYSRQGNPTLALTHAQEAAAAFARIGHPEYTKRAHQLIAQLQSGDTPEAAFEAFQRADSSVAMQMAVAQHPVLKDKDFIQAVLENMAEQEPLAHTAFKNRLAWLKEIVQV